MRLSDQARGRWSVALRTAAGTIGAYGVTALAIEALSLLLARTGMDRVEAVTAATLASFAVFAVIALSAFHARSAARAWGWQLTLGLPLALAVFIMAPGMQS